MTTDHRNPRPHQGLRHQRRRGPRAARDRPDGRARRVRRADRTVGLRQVDAHGDPRLPRHADGRAPTRSTASASRGSRAASSRRSATRRSGSSSSSTTCCRRPRSLRNVELPMLYAGVSRKERRAARPRAARAGRHPGEGEGPAGGALRRPAPARRDRARARQPARRCSSPTSRPARSTPKTGHEVLELFAELHRQGNTIIIVTHDLSIAAMAQRQVEIHDGLIKLEEAA